MWEWPDRQTDRDKVGREGAWYKTKRFGEGMAQDITDYSLSDKTLSWATSHTTLLGKLA